jgi:predicted PurR-regulated permease PerM
MFRLSLRSLMVLVAAIALAIASFHHASDGWRTTIVSATMLCFLLSSVAALVDRGPRRAAAIGTAVSMAVYGLALVLAAPLGASVGENPEFNPSTGSLPTTLLLRSLYSRVAEIGWVDVYSGNQAAEISSSAPLNAGDAATTTAGEIPDRETFMVIGHAWSALTLGCFGGWLARHIFLRQRGKLEN